VPEVSEQPSSQYQRSVNPDVIGQTGLPGLDELHATIVKEPHGFFIWGHTFSHLLAVAGGALIVITVGMIVGGVNSAVETSSKTVLLSMATLCLGFGMATLLNWRIRDAQWRKLEARYEALDARADALVKEVVRRDRTVSARSS
jgi:hypothetical protein